MWQLAETRERLAQIRGRYSRHTLAERYAFLAERLAAEADLKNHSPDDVGFLLDIIDNFEQQLHKLMQGRTTPLHGCHCSKCDFEWQTNEYPSPCPSCGEIWR